MLNTRIRRELFPRPDGAIYGYDIQPGRVVYVVLGSYCYPFMVTSEVTSGVTPYKDSEDTKGNSIFNDVLVYSSRKLNLDMTDVLSHRQLESFREATVSFCAELNLLDGVNTRNDYVFLDAEKAIKYLAYVYAHLTKITNLWPSK